MMYHVLQLAAVKNGIAHFTMQFSNSDIEKCREYANKTGVKCYIVMIDESEHSKFSGKG